VRLCPSRIASTKRQGLSFSRWKGNEEVCQVPIPKEAGMKPVRLASWREAEGKVRAKELKAAGHRVTFAPVDAGRLLAALKKDPPAAVVIDLDRSPAQGRDLGVALRVHGGTRGVPLLFAGGAPEKVEIVRKVLPDAGFAPWSEAGEALTRLLAAPLTDPVVPASNLAGYSGTPLPKKLGIKEGHRVLLAGGPEDFQKTLGSLPPGVTLTRRFQGRIDLILWFVRRSSELEKGIPTWAPRVGPGGIWILWPKQSSGVPSDLKQAVVRKVGLDAGLVDYKIAAVDETWSGLKFAVRKKPSPHKAVSKGGTRKGT
jgi:hypothetical protein